MRKDKRDTRAETFRFTLSSDVTVTGFLQKVPPYYRTLAGKANLFNVENRNPPVSRGSCFKRSISRSNWHFKMSLFVEGGKSDHLEKNLQSKGRTKHKLNPCCRMFLRCSNVFHSVNPSCGNKCGPRFLSCQTFSLFKRICPIPQGEVPAI